MSVNTTTVGNATIATPRVWALWAAAALAAITAVLHTFVQATPTVDALMASSADANTQQSLRMMWNGMSVIAWTYPVVLLLLQRMPATVTRPALTFVAILNGTQALFYIGTGLWGEGASGLLSLPQWALHALVAALAWLARPPRAAEEPAPSARRGRGRLVLLWFTTILTGYAAIYHAIWGTQSWPAAMWASNTTSPEKLVLYAMWLFSCIVFMSVPVALLWSLRAPAPAGRFVVGYVAVLVAALAVSWTSTMAFGYGPDMDASGPPTLGLITALTALSVPPRARPST